LPDDYKSFLQISDGLELTWKIKIGNDVEPLGCLHLNKMREIKQVKSNRFKLCKVGVEDDDESDDDNFLDPSDVKKPEIMAYDIDSLCQDGRVVLLYKDTFNKPQIWFQDLSCGWFFIANTFTDYFRLMIMHLGLPHWQYAFTDVGLDPVAEKWFRFLSPNRLQIDIKNRIKQERSTRKKDKHAADEKALNIKMDSYKRRTRYKSKSRGSGTSIIEKFNLNSSKTAKFARSSKKKKTPNTTTKTKSTLDQIDQSIKQANKSSSDKSGSSASRSSTAAKSSSLSSGGTKQ